MSVEVIWESGPADAKVEKGDLLSEVTLKDGYVHFISTGEEGNALIAAKDADGNIVPHAEGDGVYNMNALYTGSSFLLYYSADWTEEMKTIGLAQNKESVVYVAPAEPAPEK